MKVLDHVVGELAWRYLCVYQRSHDVGHSRSMSTWRIRNNFFAMYMENSVYAFGPLLCGILVKRINRFVSLVSICDEDGKLFEAECYMANPGSMLGMCVKGSELRLSLAVSATRKFPYTVEAIKIKETWIGCNTHLANIIAKKILLDRFMCNEIGMSCFDSLSTEVSLGNSRFDFVLSNLHPPLKRIVEVKTVTMASDWFDVERQNLRADRLVRNFPVERPLECVIPGTALFPDCKSIRALKHVDELLRLTRTGSTESFLFFMVMRDDVDAVAASVFCDPQYAQGLKDAMQKGVRVIAMTFRLDVTDPNRSHVYLIRSIPVQLIETPETEYSRPSKRRKK